MIGPRRHHSRCVLARQLRIPGVQIRIIQVTLEHALLEAIRHRHMRYTSVEGIHTSMAAQPIAALHILGRPGKQQLTEAKAGDKDIGLADLTGFYLDPLERVAGIIHFHALARNKLACRHRGLPVLRELAVELLPEVRVGRQVLGFFFPQELQRMTQSQIVNDRWPVQLQHPQRVGRRFWYGRRHTQAVTYFAHRMARAA